MYTRMMANSAMTRITASPSSPRERTEPANAEVREVFIGSAPLDLIRHRDKGEQRPQSCYLPFVARLEFQFPSPACHHLPRIGLHPESFHIGQNTTPGSTPHLAQDGIRQEPIRDVALSVRDPQDDPFRILFDD